MIIKKRKKKEKKDEKNKGELNLMKSNLKV